MILLSIIINLNSLIMNIGITCYPTYGGSGVVATELGIGLAKRGSNVHFISYDIPFRLAHYYKNIFFRLSRHDGKLTKNRVYSYRNSCFGCIICGKPTDELFNNMCKTCYINNTELAEVPDRVIITLCPECFSYMFRGRWIRPEDPNDLYHVVHEAVLRNISACASSVKYVIRMSKSGKYTLP